MANSRSVSFSVVFSFGNNDINIRSVMVDPTTNFKRLLYLLSRKIGISSFQFSVFLATVGSNRRIPVIAKFNLVAVMCDGGAHYFFVKRSAWSKKSLLNGRNSVPSKSPPENVTL